MFIAACNFIVSCTTFLTRVLVFMTTLDEKALFEPVPCSLGLAACLAVAFKQLHPERTLGPVKVVYLPGLLVGLSSLVSLATMSVNSISVVSASVYVSWIYLRFFQVHAEYDFTFTIGDESDHF